MPVALGLVATVCAFALVGGWVAVGSFLLGGTADDDEAAAPVAVVIGSGVSGFALALVTRNGLVHSGVVVVLVVIAAALVARRKRTLRILRAALAPLTDRTLHWSARAAIIGMGVVLWLSAIAPPRTADAMRYHLAHIRQIIRDGGWQTISDYHYALPFGWSLSFLPFELIGLPQGAALVGVVLFLLLCCGILRAMRSRGVPPPIAAVPLLILFHPGVARVFAEPTADAYAIIAVFTICLLIMRLGEESSHPAMLGFVSWIGIQSRYQLAAMGVAATFVAIFVIVRRPHWRRDLVAFAVGSATAVALASPFYITNFRAFGNPVWPLMIDNPEGTASFADYVASMYSRSLTGSHDPAAIAESLRTLFTNPVFFPVPIVIIGSVFLAVFSRIKPLQRLGRVGVVFFVLWLTMQPLLYPRFILLMVPITVLAVGLLLATRMTRLAPERGLSYLSTVGLITGIILTAFVTRDSIRFAVTGDEREYHRFTWFYSVFQWVNRSTPRNDHFLVIVSSAQTYYLDRPYRRADPWLSGVVDWPRTATGRALSSMLDRDRYSYVIYEDRDWSDFAGGREMRNAVMEAVVSKDLIPVRSFDERLYTSRFRREYRDTRVYVLARRR